MVGVYRSGGVGGAVRTVVGSVRWAVRSPHLKPQMFRLIVMCAEGISEGVVNKGRCKLLAMRIRTLGAAVSNTYC